MSNLPPGVSESMIPGNEPDPNMYEVVPEDFVEVTVEEWTEWNVGEGEAECDACKAMVGAFLYCSDSWEPETLEWAICWTIGDKVVCDDCRDFFLTESARMQAELDAAPDFD